MNTEATKSARKPPEKSLAAQLKSKAIYESSRKGIRVRYTSDDYKSIADNAKNAGITPTEFVRLSALKKHIKPIDPNQKYRTEFRNEVRKIGVNINQMAKALNSRYDFPDVIKMKEELAGFTATLKEILTALS